MFSKSLQNIVSSLDDGPLTCIFNQLPKDLDSKKTLMFAEEFKIQGHTLNDLLNIYYHRIKPSLHQTLVQTSICQWIFSTNAIEFAGTKTLKETEEVIQNYQKDTFSNTSSNISENISVIKLYQLVQKLSKPPGQPLEQYCFDSVSLSSWHRLMFAETRAGQYRKSGVETINNDQTIHKYPHHTLVQNILPKFCEKSYYLAKSINLIEQPSLKLQYIFAFAAFVQFHLVDIHPWSDGNGRMCRLLSKRILDSILPIPIPMFTDRDLYLKCLQLGRKEIEFERCPFLLCQLLFSEAIRFYTNVLLQYVF